MSKAKRMPKAQTSRVEREQTDESLGEERHKTDDALAANRKLVQDLADEVVERAREQADEVLGEAREKADQKLDEESEEGRASTELAREALAQERSDEDGVLLAERSSADQSLLWEREEQARILAALLPLEREKTDRYLLTERGISDDALVNRDDLMGMVSHDLRNLLAGIAIHARVLADQASDSEEGKKAIQGMGRIEHYVASMNRLIGDLVDVTSIDAGRFAVHPYPGDVAEVIAEGIAPFTETAKEKGLCLGFATEGQKLPGLFDWGRMLQVMANLIANAMKSTHRGGTITVKAAGEGDQVRVSVLDTGEGIAGNLREAIFKRFGQGDGTNQAGLGLGLYISKCIVEAHGGRIWVEDNPTGPGSAFHFTILSAGDAIALRTPPGPLR